MFVGHRGKQFPIVCPAVGALLTRQQYIFDLTGEERHSGCKKKRNILSENVF